MPVYEIEQYEIHAQKFRAEAPSEAEAISKLFCGECELVDNSLEFIGACDDLGMPAEEYPQLAQELRDLSEMVGDDVIPSIRSIEIVEE